MITVGIDFGASRLKVATDQSGAPALVHHKFEAQRMVWLVDGQIPIGAKHSGRFHILSLKRMLDFDRSFRLPVGIVNSLDHLATIFRAAMDDCKIQLNSEDARCVLAVPSCFSQRQRSSLRTAAGRAGFRQVKLVDDSMAALLASRTSFNGASSALVFALGAGSFSCSLFQLVQGTFRPAAQEGDRDLGGGDIDSAILNHVSDALLNDVRVRPLMDNADFRRHLVTECERVKLEIARGGTAGFQFDPILTSASLRDLPSFSVPRSIYEQAVQKLVRASMELLDKVLADTKPVPPEAVLLVGASTQLPEIRQALKDRLSIETFHEASESSVACGAVLYSSLVPLKDWERAEVPLEEKIDPESVPQPAPPSSSPSTAIQARSQNQPSTWAELFVPMIVKAQELDGRGRWEECLQTFEDLLDKMNDFAGGLYSKVAASWQAAGERDKALKLLAEANRRNPRNRPVAAKLAEAAYVYATELRKRRNFEGALRIISHAVEAVRVLPSAATEHPAFLAKLMHLEACLLFEHNRPSDAESTLMQCIKLDPSVKEYHEHLVTVQQALKASGFRWFKKTPPVPVDSGRKKKQRPNDLCACGSGKKYKKCHGAR